MKQCSRCGLAKEVAEFANDKQKKDGLRNWCRACVRDHRQSNAESVRASRKRYVTENRETVLQKSREYHEANRDSILARKRKYDAENKERTAKRTSDYYRLHPEKRWVNAYQNRAKAYGLTPVVEDFTQQDVIERYGEACHYCPSGAFDELDHHIPVAAGGVHSLGNVRPSCSPCNNAKSQSDRAAAMTFRELQATND